MGSQPSRCGLFSYSVDSDPWVTMGQSLAHSNETPWLQGLQVTRWEYNGVQMVWASTPQALL